MARFLAAMAEVREAAPAIDGVMATKVARSYMCACNNIVYTYYKIPYNYGSIL